MLFNSLNILLRNVINFKFINVYVLRQKMGEYLLCLTNLLLWIGKKTMTLCLTETN